MHLHSPLSGLNNQFPMKDGAPDWEPYLAAIESLKDIPAIAITDYFLIDGYKELKKFKDGGRLKKIQLMLPNIEFRLDNIVGGKRINFHVIFSDEVKPEQIEDHFLANIDVKLENSPWLPADIRKLKRSSLVELGAKLKADHAEFRDHRSDFEIGCMNAVTKLDQIMSLLTTNSIFKGRYLTALAEENMSLMDWDGQDHGLRKLILQSSHILFSANPNSIQWCLGKKHPHPDDYVQEFKSLKPCVIGSDAHEISKIGVPPNGKFTWIKSDVSFEGLKQILYEPELRVRIQPDDPSEEEAYAKIDNLDVNFPGDLCIKDKQSSEHMAFCIQGKKEVTFSSNLTCIIGGRGSGKSTLVHLLYNLSRNIDIDRLLKINSPLVDLQLGTKDALAKVRSLTKADVPVSSEFFLQNEVEKFAKDIEEMSKLIRTRLYALSAIDPNSDLAGLEIGWDISAGECEKLIEAYDKIVEIDQKVELLTKQKATLKKQTEVIGSQEYKTLQSEIEKCATEISAFKTFEKEKTQLLGDVAKLTKTIAALDWNKYDAQGALDSLSAEVERKRAEIEQAFSAAKTKHDEAGYERQANDKLAELRKFLTEKGLSPENIGEVAAASQKIADLDEQIKALHKEKVPYEDTYTRRDTILAEQQKAYNSYKKSYEAVANLLQTGLSKLKFDEQEGNISFRFQVNEEALKDWVVEFVKENNSSEVTLRSDFIQNVVFGGGHSDISKLVADRSGIVEAVNASTMADAHTQILQELIGDDTLVEKFFLRIQRRYCDIENIQVQTRLGDKSLQSTSFGERCGIVIAIVLVAGTNPIVIDQPEDNLDGKYISKVLVPLLREQKQHRQIILVTRDANIVIGADSELLVILTKEAGGTAMLPATIEEKARRAEYIWILDGGERAFQKREEKYSITK